jgi:hypothetical protein
MDAGHLLEQEGFSISLSWRLFEVDKITVRVGKHAQQPKRKQTCPLEHKIIIILGRGCGASLELY